MGALLVPAKHTAFPYDIKVSSSTVKLAIGKATTRTSNKTNIFDSRQLINFDTGRQFATANEFIGNKQRTRGDTTDSYSNKHNFPLEKDYLEIIDRLKNPQNRFPWDNTNMIIMTNGFCGSACGLFAQYLHEIGGITTVAVGGFSGKDLSYTTFPGGNSLVQSDILSALQDLNLTSETNPDIPSPLEYKGNFDLLFREAYSLKNPELVLDFQYRPADKRLFYDAKSARDPSILWVQAANLLDKHDTANR